MSGWFDRPVALDLFSGAGGAARGLQQAGFRVIGVDIKPQPRYAGDMFVQADALTYDTKGVDFVWASPPCQRYSLGSLRWDPSVYPDYIPKVRTRLAASDLPYVIENVPLAPLRNDLTLCGTMFGLRVIRHRWFESNVTLNAPPHQCAPRGCTKRKEYVTVAGHGGYGSNALAEWCEAMRIGWMNKTELAEAIPPAYAEYIGRQIIETIVVP
jgi:DNA (cytosine-5)-methyltransferase 1